MNKKILFVGLLGLTSVAYSWNSDSDPEQVFEAMYQPYFESLRLHYEVPAGCVGNNSGKYDSTNQPRQNCAVIGDFNGDGSVDYAALLEYIGAGSRSGNRYLDLVVLFSSDTQGEPRHQLFTHMGSVDERGVVDTFLNVQPTGEIELPSGVQNLDKPGINLLSTIRENVDPWTYPTIYWDQRLQSFYSITKASD